MLVGPARWPGSPSLPLSCLPLSRRSVLPSPSPLGSPRGLPNILLDKILSRCWPGSSGLHPGLLHCFPRSPHMHWGAEIRGQGCSGSWIVGGREASSYWPTRASESRWRQRRARNQAPAALKAAPLGRAGGTEAGWAYGSPAPHIAPASQALTTAPLSVRLCQRGSKR